MQRGNCLMTQVIMCVYPEEAQLELAYREYPSPRLTVLPSGSWLWPCIPLPPSQGWSQWLFVGGSDVILDLSCSDSYLPLYPWDSCPPPPPYKAKRQPGSDLCTSAPQASLPGGHGLTSSRRTWFLALMSSSSAWPRSLRAAAFTRLSSCTTDSDPLGLFSWPGAPQAPPSCQARGYTPAPAS